MNFFVLKNVILHLSMFPHLRYQWMYPVFKRLIWSPWNFSTSNSVGRQNRKFLSNLSFCIDWDREEKTCLCHHYSVQSPRNESKTTAKWDPHTVNVPINAKIGWHKGEDIQINYNQKNVITEISFFLLALKSHNDVSLDFCSILPEFRLWAA